MAKANFSTKIILGCLLYSESKIRPKLHLVKKNKECRTYRGETNVFYGLCVYGYKLWLWTEKLCFWLQTHSSDCNRNTPQDKAIYWSEQGHTEHLIRNYIFHGVFSCLTWQNTSTSFPHTNQSNRLLSYDEPCCRKTQILATSGAQKLF